MASGLWQKLTTTITDVRIDWERRQHEQFGCDYRDGQCTVHGATKEIPKRTKKTTSTAGRGRIRAIKMPTHTRPKKQRPRGLF